MDGVINIYKEKGYTSFHAVAVLRHFTGVKKIGHTGTLDPDAEGVLPICIGKATKLVGQLTDTDKKYKAVMKLGLKTDTQDISGSPIETMPPKEVVARLEKIDIPAVFDEFKGCISQKAPMYSAVKVNGVKLVDAARKGKRIDQPVRNVTVYDFTGIEIDRSNQEISFEVHCSKGTYIRTICEDIGNHIGIPACMKSLIRTRAAGLGIDSSVLLSDIPRIAEEESIEKYIIPTDRFLTDYQEILVNDDAVKRLVFGNYLYDDDFISMQKLPGVYRVYDKKGIFYALYRYDEKDNCFKCEKMFY